MDDGIAYMVVAIDRRGAHGTPTDLPGTPALLLTARQLSVLRATAAGCTNAEMAREFRVSAHTIKSEIAHLLEAFGARNRANLVATASRAGLL